MKFPSVCKVFLRSDLIYSSDQEPIPTGGGCSPIANEPVPISSSLVDAKSEGFAIYPGASEGEAFLVVWFCAWITYLRTADCTDPLTLARSFSVLPVERLAYTGQIP